MAYHDKKILTEIQKIDIEIGKLMRKLGLMGEERPKELTDRLDKLFHDHNEKWIEFDSGMAGHVRGMYYKYEAGEWKLF